MNPNKKEVVTLQEAKLAEGKSNEINSATEGIVTEGILLVPFVALLCWLILSIRALKALKAVQNKTAIPLNCNNNFPCKKCYFFLNNHYLKCAIHPSVVLTEQASNCPDYCSQKDKIS
ncbi:hypothetical protein H6F98_08880 [Microcoleus sp. FACHB-SPT15]|uniref:hypothetical protein n=1 Tax=Microcoleus sp. FACHB-SPT15 TaxID=2692830 RepID=UPI001784372A|nr:hypothetical protein [Microcoleus sp. FACHB-SPT15]MBD1805560.1 hypothetical protein [Microcoleus sp. FACHB-SPT15]